VTEENAAVADLGPVAQTARFVGLVRFECSESVGMISRSVLRRALEGWLVAQNACRRVT
jgi:hypothetical protein